MVKIDLQASHTLRTAATITALSKPLLKEFNISYFKYDKIYNDGSRIILCNRPEVINYFYNEERYKQAWFYNKHPDEITTSSHLWVTKKINNTAIQNQQLIDFAIFFHLTQGIFYLTKQKDYFEIYNFAANTADIYDLKPSIFTQFMFYFKNEAHKLIQTSETEKIIIPFEKPSSKKNAEHLRAKEVNFSSNLSLNRFYLQGDHAGIYLTLREVECLRLCAHGNSSAEIAVALGTRNRTIQHHFENIKTKLNCSKLSEIISIAIQQNLIAY